MSIYRKNEGGVLNTITKPISQRWNDRIFQTIHSVSGGEDYYDIEPAASKYILGLNNFTEYQLYIAETNATKFVNIRFNGQSLRLECMTEEMVIGGLLGKTHCYTLDTATGKIWVDNLVELQLVKQELVSKQNRDEKGQPNGYAPLGADSKVPSAYIANTFDDVLEFATYALLLEYLEPRTNTLYVVIADETSSGNHSVYRWSGSIYIKVHDELSAEEVKILYESNPNTNPLTDAEKLQIAAADTHRLAEGNPHGTTYEEILQKPTIYTAAEVDAIVEPFDQAISDMQSSVNTMEQSVADMLAALTIVYDL